MNTEAATEQQPQTPSFAMIRTLAGVALISGFLVVLVFQWTLPIIEENQRIAIEKAIFSVVPNAVSRQDFLLGENGILPGSKEAPKGTEKIYAAYGDTGQLSGIALQAAAQGYQDVIKILYGYDPSCQCITGIKVLKMTETPGLGDKIAFDPEFLKNFTALDASLDPGGTGLNNKIVAVKHGAKKNPWEIDAISGATVSSNAIGRMLNASAQRVVPVIQRHLDTLQPQP